MDLFTTEQLEAVCGLLNKCTGISRIKMVDLEDFQSRDSYIDFDEKTKEFVVLPLL